MCLGAWTKQKLVKNSELIQASKLPDVDEDNEMIVDDYRIV
jgi:predicted RNA-binding protein with PUA domain